MHLNHEMPASCQWMAADAITLKLSPRKPLLFGGLGIRGGLLLTFLIFRFVFAYHEALL